MEQVGGERLFRDVADLYLFRQRVADSLRRAALDLALHRERIYRRADVDRLDEVEQADGVYFLMVLGLHHADGEGVGTGVGLVEAAADDDAAALVEERPLYRRAEVQLFAADVKYPLAEDDLVFRYLVEYFFQRFIDVETGAVDGGAADEGLAAAEGPSVVRGDLRVGRRDRHLRKRDFERFGGDLREHRFAALTDVRRADEQLDAAVAVDVDDRRAEPLLRRRPGAVAAEGDSPCLADIVVVDQPFRGVYLFTFLHADAHALLDLAACNRQLRAWEMPADGDVVLEAQLYRVDAELP